jgi:hypothetical protein
MYGLLPAAERTSTETKSTAAAASAYQLRQAECGTQNITRKTKPDTLPGLKNTEPDAARTNALLS